ncbi:MAG: DEAD/DEAH box helicase, partial [Bacteroidota bacterium]
MTFDDFDLAPSLMEGIEGMRYKTPTPIQAEAIPIILGNHDLIGCAQTGTGKTAAFIVPVIHKLTQSPGKGIKCLAIAPTRELAQQIDQQVDGLGYFTGIRSAAVYGGNQPAEFRLQKQAILEGADIVISTPGRLISHLNLGYVDLSSLEVLILDEADRMLDMGFIDDIMRIVKLLPKERQTLMFSATMAAGIRKLAQQILREPKQINLAIAKPAEGITQKGYMVYDDNKIKLLEHLIKGEDVQNMLIFASKKSSVDSIVRALRKLDLNASSMHSGKSQDERNETLRKFRANAVQILVATDILSRGIDIEGLSHVLNYDIPDDPADYVHRIGR